MVNSYLVMKNKPLYSTFKFLNYLKFIFCSRVMPKFAFESIDTDSPAVLSSHQHHYIDPITLAKGQIF